LLIFLLEEEEEAVVVVGKDKNDDGDDGRDVGKPFGEDITLAKLCAVSFCLSKVRPGDEHDSCDCVWGVLGGAQKLIVASWEGKRDWPMILSLFAMYPKELVIVSGVFVLVLPFSSFLMNFCVGDIRSGLFCSVCFLFLLASGLLCTALLALSRFTSLLLALALLRVLLACLIFCLILRRAFFDFSFFFDADEGKVGMLSAARDVGGDDILLRAVNAL
jgi:hypothetical protein